MENRTYRVILSGSVKEGFSPETAVRNLAALFKRDEQRIRGLLAGKPRVVRADMDHQTALKYQKLIERAGAVCTVEEDPLPPEEKTPPPKDERSVLRRAQESTDPHASNPLRETDSKPTEPQRQPTSEGTCPRCGYTAKRDDDVLLTRGDCPKCGLMVRPVRRGLDKPARLNSGAMVGTGESFYNVADGDDPYGGRQPATARTRVLAVLYSFGTFLILYCGLTLLLILVVAPASQIPHQIFRGFLETAVTVAPIITTVMCISMITMVVPLFNDGLTLGQRIAGIEIIHGREALTSGPYLSLVFRGAGAGLLSLVPGQVLMTVAEWFGLMWEWRGQTIAVLVTATLAWTVAGFVWMRSESKISALDFFSGTVQSENFGQQPVTVNTAIRPLLGAGAFLLLLGIIVPLGLRLIGW